MLRIWNLFILFPEIKENVFTSNYNLAVFVTFNFFKLLKHRLIIIEIEH